MRRLTNMIDFRAMLKLKEQPHLTDEQVDELIASKDGKCIWHLGAYATMSKLAETKIRAVIPHYEVVARKVN